jgi:hypothetical protein
MRRPEMSDRLQTPSLELARAAQARSREFVRATPVVPLYGEHAEVLCSLKLEFVQDPWRSERDPDRHRY